MRSQFSLLFGATVSDQFGDQSLGNMVSTWEMQSRIKEGKIKPCGFCRTESNGLMRMVRNNHLGNLRSDSCALGSLSVSCASAGEGRFYCVGRATRLPRVSIACPICLPRSFVSWSPLLSRWSLRYLVIARTCSGYNFPCKRA